MPLKAACAEFPESDFETEEIDGVLTITDYLGTSRYITIPAEIGGKPVKAIGDRAFYDVFFYEATISEGIESIGELAFSRLGYLVNVPASVKELIGDTWEHSFGLKRMKNYDERDKRGSFIVECCDLHVVRDSYVQDFLIENLPSNYFYTDKLNGYMVSIRNGEAVLSGRAATDTPSGNESETNLILPGDFDGCPLVAIGNNALAYCNSATVTFPASLREIYTNAFADSKGITELTIPGTLEVIRDQAFAGCVNMKKVTIEAGVKELYASAFLDCGGLKEIYIPDGCVIRETSLVSIDTDRDDITVYGSAGSGAKEFAELIGAVYSETN